MLDIANVNDEKVFVRQEWTIDKIHEKIFLKMMKNDIIIGYIQWSFDKFLEETDFIKEEIKNGKCGY